MSLVQCNVHFLHETKAKNCVSKLYAVVFIESEHPRPREMLL